jgi:hypothetical protein
MGLFGAKKKSGTSFQFRVSDALEVPGRGYLLRLKLNSGEAGLDDLGAGKSITLRGPNGTERTVPIKEISLTVGAPSQVRLDRTRELDIVIDTADAVVNGQVVDIGWTASGPASSD